MKTSKMFKAYMGLGASMIDLTPYKTLINSNSTGMEFDQAPSKEMILQQTLEPVPLEPIQQTKYIPPVEYTPPAEFAQPIELAPLFEPTMPPVEYTPPIDLAPVVKPKSLIEFTPPIVPEFIKVPGTVVDEYKNPLPGAHIYVGNTAKTITAANGAFMVEALPTAIIHVTYIGYKNKTFQAKSVPHTVVLEPEFTALDEVIVSADPNNNVKKAGFNWFFGLLLIGFTVAALSKKDKPKPVKAKM